MPPLWCRAPQGFTAPPDQARDGQNFAGGRGGFGGGAPECDVPPLPPFLPPFGIGNAPAAFSVIFWVRGPCWRPKRARTAPPAPKTSQNAPKKAIFNSHGEYFFSGREPIGMSSKLRIPWNLESGQSPHEKLRSGSFPATSQLKSPPAVGRLTWIPVNRNPAMGPYIGPILQ